MKMSFIFQTNSHIQQPNLPATCQRDLKNIQHMWKKCNEENLSNSTHKLIAVK